MTTSLDDIILSAKTLPLVPLDGTHAYQEHIPKLTQIVDDELGSNPDIPHIIGNNPLQVMYDNHRHHAAFMATVFSIGDYELLARTVPWVYRAYHAHGFSYDYFPLELQSWKRAIHTYLKEDKNIQILAVYDWMLSNHDAFIQLSTTDSDEKLPIDESWMPTLHAFIDGALEGSYKECTKLAREYVQTTGELSALYLQIIQPAMYEIGRKWERAEISVAQEHLASAVVTRIMAEIHALTSSTEVIKGKAVITSSPNELHELGAWMVSDILEQDGWQVRYLGANTPTNDLLDLLNNFIPDILVISVTMPFNVVKTQELIEEIRKNPLHDTMKIMVGGRVFIDNPQLSKNIGADGFAQNSDEAIRLSRSWCE